MDGSSGEAPESDCFVIGHQRRQREEGEGQSQPEEPREDRGGRCPDGSSREAPESDFFLITRNRRQREEGGGQSQPEEPGGGQRRPARRDSGEVPEKEPWSRLRQRRDRPRRKLRRGPGVGWDWFSNSFPLVFLSKPIREPKKTLKNQRGPLKT